MQSYEYLCGGLELLDTIEPLWTKLNQLHRTVSSHFSDRAATQSFTERKQGLLEKTTQGKLRVEVAKTSAQQSTIAYCVSTINREGTGEIDSLFVEEDHRGNGIADHLMRGALDWMEQEHVRATLLVVLWGNEQVHPFYQRYGFFPLSTTMMQKKAPR
jgi:GNAT superfamily N-acetyltransferase